jgi:hypothetical protein
MREPVAGYLYEKGIGIWATDVIMLFTHTADIAVAFEIPKPKESSLNGTRCLLVRAGASGRTNDHDGASGQSERD